MKFLKKATLILGLGLALQGSAQAALVNVWDYTFNSYWQSTAPTAPTVTSNGALGTAAATNLSWGVSTGFGQSGLNILAPTVTGLQVTTNGPQADGTLLQHNNQPITGGSLTSAVLRTSLQLQAFSPIPGAPLAPFVNFLNIAFTETPNATPCASVSTVPCNDIFVLTTPAQNLFFNYGSQNYEVNIFPKVGLGVLPLTAAECAAAGVAAGCQGFTTAENGLRNLQLAFTVSAVPEPGSMALVGLALLGLAAVRRRRQI